MASFSPPRRTGFAPQVDAQGNQVSEVLPNEFKTLGLTRQQLEQQLVAAHRSGNVQAAQQAAYAIRAYDQNILSAQVPSINAPPPIDRVPKPTFGSYLENLGIGYGEELGKQVRDIGGMVERGVSAFRQDPLKASAAAFMSVLEPARQGFTQPVQTAKDVGAGVVETGKQMYQQAQSGPIGLGGVMGQLGGLPGPDMPGRRKPTMAELDVYHGTPHTFDPEEGAPLGRFRAEKIGTGEGAQAYGYGLYLAENQKVAGGYRSSLSPQPFPDKDPRNGAWIIYNNKGEDAALKYLSEDFPADQVENALAEVKAAKSGNVYKVDLPDAKIEQMLDWNKPISQQPKSVRDAFESIFTNPQIADNELIDWYKNAADPTGSGLYQRLMTSDKLPGNGQREASRILAELGVPGIKYLDEGSRGNFRVQNKYKGQNYGEAVSFKTEQQAKDYAAEQVAKGFEADVQPGTRNFVVFPGEEQNLTVLERNGERAVAPATPSAQQARLGSIDIRNLSPQQAAIAQRSRSLWSSGSAPEIIPQLLGPDNTPLTEYFARNPDVKTFVDQNPGVVSTRFPTAVKSQENPRSGNLLVDYSVAKSDPKSFEKNINIMSAYPNFRVDTRGGYDQQAEQMIEQMQSNLLFLHDTMPQNYRDRSHLWYVGARNIVDSWSPQYELPDQAIAGVLAVLSPQKDWFQNVSLAQRVLDITKNQRDFSWNKKMDAKASEIWDSKYDPVLSLVRNKKFGELTSPEEKALWLRTYDQAFNPPDHLVVSPEGNFEGPRLTDSGGRRKIAWGSLNEIGKAVAIVDNPEIDNISRLLGDMHKVRSFYSNIYAPFDPRGPATIDTHAVAAAMLRPLSGKSREVLHNFGSGVVGEGGPGKSSVLGMNGTYGIILEAYRRAAAQRGLLPRELQSITWEGVRGLFPDKWKRPQNAVTIDAIWNRYRNGDITLQEAQDAVIKASPNKGTGVPEWARSAK